MVQRISNEVILEKLERLSEDVATIQEKVDTLQQDYYERKAVHKLLLFLISTISAGVAWLTTLFLK